MTGRFKPRIAPRPLDPVIRRLRSLAPLSEQEQLFVSSLGDRRQRHAPGEEIVSEGERAPRLHFLLSGWAARQRVMLDGRRQIFGFLLPGDPVGLAAPGEAALDCVVAITSVELLDAAPVLEAADSGRAPGLKRALAEARASERALLLDHVVRLGRQTAYERVAHFLLELQHRMQIAGHGDAQRFPLPLTQEILADALGLSIVHVNRTLQQLRRERLIELRSGIAILLQPELLASLSDFRRPAPAHRQAARA